MALTKLSNIPIRVKISEDEGSIQPGRLVTSADSGDGSWVLCEYTGDGGLRILDEGKPIRADPCPPMELQEIGYESTMWHTQWDDVFIRLNLDGRLIVIANLCMYRNSENKVALNLSEMKGHLKNHFPRFLDLVDQDLLDKMVYDLKSLYHHLYLGYNFNDPMGDYVLKRLHCWAPKLSDSELLYYAQSPEALKIIL